MRPISSKPILTLSFLARNNPHHSSPFSTQIHQNPFFSGRRQEEESRCVRVSVWWDFENCNLPLSTNAFRVGQCIMNTLRANGIRGPIQITAFGDVMQISRTNQEALSSSGIVLTHVPSGGKNSADRSLLLDLMDWVSRNPPPAHLFLISGDRDFAGILHRLRMKNYNILLASPDCAPSALCCVATIMWQWSSLLKGENLNGKLFNQPPDGLNHSWYGYYKATLEDPFAVDEPALCVNSNESVESGLESKTRPIPKPVMKLICHILNSYPEGLPITILRGELARSNLTIDKDFYGHKKFSKFLLAMPHVLKLYSINDGQFMVRRANAKLLDEAVPDGQVEPQVGGNFKTDCGSSSFEEVIGNPTLHPVQDSKLKAQPTNSLEARKEEKHDETSLSMNIQGMKMKGYATNLEDLKKEEKRKESSSKIKTQEMREQDNKVKLPEQTERVVVDEIKNLSEKNENQMLVLNPSSPASEFGIFRRVWMKWFGNEEANFNHKMENDEKNISSELMRPALFSPSSHEALIDGKNSPTGDVVNDISTHETSFFNRIMSWFKFRSSSEIDEKVEKNSESEDLVKANRNPVELFSKESFWNELKSFIDTPQGSASFSQSRTRGQLVQNLQRQGPPVLRSLSEGQLLQLVELLISDKKWVEEFKSRTFPFKLTRPSGKDPRDDPPLNTNGLSQIFSGRQPNPPELGERIKHQNPPHTGVAQPVIHRNSSSSKTRGELLADCQKLADHIVKAYPEGFNLGSFRKLFLERNGYALDLQKLGYEKLVNLLQIMPGLRIESNLIFPAGPFKSPGPPNIPIQESKVGQHSVLSTKDDDSDSSWDELGPIDNSGPGKEKTGPRLTRKGKKGKAAYDYEPIRDDDISDSEDETCTESELRLKLEEESSLLQILDSWYSNKGGDGKKDDGSNSNTTNVTDKAEVVVSQPLAQTNSGTKNETPHVGPPKKPKPSKSYSFVTEQSLESKDKLVDGILGSLKKSGERSSDSRMLG